MHTSNLVSYNTVNLLPTIVATLFQVDESSHDTSVHKIRDKNITMASFPIIHTHPLRHIRQRSLTVLRALWATFDIATKTYAELSCIVTSIALSEDPSFYVIE